MERLDEQQYRQTSVSERWNSRFPWAAIVLAPIAVAPIGCSSGAHREVYQQRMAGEIRTLEDQLYEADYQNRVLHDQLEQCRVTTGKTSPPTTATDATRRDRSVLDATADPVPRPRSYRGDSAPADPAATESQSIDREDGLESDLLEVPSFDTGEMVDPDALIDPQADPLPAPGLPEPPGLDDITVPPIDPGDPLPPPNAGSGSDSPRPGRVELPATLNGLTGVPDSLQIHPGLTTGVESEAEQNQMTVVITVVDQTGRTVDLDRFDIDAQLSVVVLDPEREPAESRIGRWDFSTDQLAQLVKQSPVSALHVPVQWQGDRPSGERVIVHARLRAEEDEMRCQRRVVVDKQPAIAEWTPRGEDTRR